MSNTLNWYAGIGPSVAITTGTQTVIGVIVREGDDGNSATGATLNGVAGTLIGRTAYSGASESNITAVLFTTIPAAGNYTLQATGGSEGTQTVTYVYEFDDALTPSDFASQDFGLSASSPFVMNYSVAGLAGARLLVVAAAADTNDIGAAAKPTKPAELDEISDSMSLVRLQVSTGVDSSVLTDPEVYQFTFTDDSLAGGTMGRMTAASFALSLAAAGLTCDSITGGTIRAGDTVTIQLSNATNASGKTLSIPQGSITPSAQDINSISFIAPDLKTFGDKTGDYSTNITITVTDGAESDTIDFQIAPDVGDEVGAITALEGIYTAPEFSAVAITDLYYTATISGADFTVGAVPVLSTDQVFNLWIQDQDGGAWGTAFEVTVPGSATAESIILRPVLHDVLRPVLKGITEG